MPLLYLCRLISPRFAAWINGLIIAGLIVIVGLSLAALNLPLRQIMQTL